MNEGIQYKKIIRINENRLKEQMDEIVEEYALTIVINGREFTTLVCSPMDVKFLVIGFLASEGMIYNIDQIKQLSIDPERGFAYVELNHEPELQSADKRWVGSCCGKSRSFYFQSDAKTARTVWQSFCVPVNTCVQLMQKFHEQSDLFYRTGGVHQASLATKDGLEVTFSDIGRHNTLDKIYGYMISNKLKKADYIIIFSGRISSEVLLKVSKMKIGFLLSKSAPTNLALQLAEDLNITTVGFLRGESMNVYTHAERLDVESVREAVCEIEGGRGYDGT